MAVAKTPHSLDVWMHAIISCPNTGLYVDISVTVLGK